MRTWRFQGPRPGTSIKPVEILNEGNECKLTLKLAGVWQGPPADGVKMPPDTLREIQKDLRTRAKDLPALEHYRQCRADAIAEKKRATHLLNRISELEVQRQHVEMGHGKGWASECAQLDGEI